MNVQSSGERVQEAGAKLLNVLVAEFWTKNRNI